MDKEIEQLLQQVRTSGRAPYWQDSLDAIRTRPTLMGLLFGQTPPTQRVQDVRFTSQDGASVGARLYLPSPDPAGLVVYFHGGGWVVGSVEGYHHFTSDLAQRTGCAVLSVDYRLAPEHAYPLPVHDAVAAMTYAARMAPEWLGPGTKPLIAMGDSAGGALATVAARRHNAGASGRPVDLQVLVYPICDARFDTPSYLEFEEGYLLTRKDMQWFWQQYCPDARLREEADCAPLQASDFTGSPPALVLTAALDPLRDEGECYARKLADAGVSCELVRCGGLVHGFLAMARTAPSAGRAYDRIAQAIRLATR